MDYNLVKIFLAVAHHRSLTRAAEALDLTQPGVSMAMRKLTQTVGYTLYQRSGRGIRLTSEGEWLAQRFAQAAELINVSDGPQPMTLLCTESLLYRLHGKLDVAIEESPFDEQQITEQLYQRRAHLVIDHIARQGSSFVSEAIFQDEMLVICSKTHPRVREQLSEQDDFRERHVALNVVRQNMAVSTG